MNRKNKALIFPKEHGSWALTFEPLTLAILIAPSWAGFILFLGAGLAFFAHPSAKVLLQSHFKDRGAGIIFLLFALPAAGLLIWYLRRTTFPVYLPLLSALGLMLFYLLLEAFNLGRALATELMASLAMGLIALSLVVSGGMSWPLAAGFLAVVYSRSLMTTIYIHYRLLLLKNRSQTVWPNHVLHLLDLLLMLYLWYAHLVPALAFVAVTILTLRAFWGVSLKAGKTTVRKLGFQEVYFGLIFLVLVLSGYWFGI